MRGSRVAKKREVNHELGVYAIGPIYSVWRGEENRSEPGQWGPLSRGTFFLD